MSGCIVVAVIRPKDGAHERVREVLTSVIPDVHREEGCELYALHEGTSGELVFVEKWTTRDLWQAHMDGPTVAAIGDGVDGLLEEPVEIFELTGIAAGEAVKGLL